MSAAKPAAGGAAKPATPAGDKRPGSSAGAKGAKAATGKGKAGDKGANGDAPAAGMLLREEDKVGHQVVQKVFASLSHVPAPPKHPSEEL